MIRYVIALSLGLVACNEASDRVTRVASPVDEFHFRTRCNAKRYERCLRDAREICPNGYSKEEVSAGEFVFVCHGKPNW